MKRLYRVVTLFILITLICVSCAADTGIGVYLDGEKLTFDVSPKITDGRTMVPLRGIFEAMGASVDWDNETKTVTAVKDTQTVKMTIGSTDVYISGSVREMDAAPIISHGRTLVPARFVAESFGAYVYWDSANRNVLIYTDLHIPEYSGSPYVVVNDNMPYFKAEDYTLKAFENYSELDSLGRCGPAYANICTEIMPTEPRGEIGNVKPSGWHTVKYDFVDGKYLYNRCHLIGYQLAGENANEKNLITGTRYMNATGMLPFENEVDDYVEMTNNHVLYRVTPFFTGNNLIADGVLMEAYSVEDNGKGVCFNVFCYNVQPGVVIDYETGDSYAADGSPAYSDGKVITNGSESVIHTSGSYVGNKSSKKFHLPSCKGAENTKDKNKIYFISREEALGEGYSPCSICNP